MRVLFAGTPEIAVPTLKAIIRTSHEVVGVLTTPDRLVGRGRKTESSPVKRVATAHSITTIEPELLDADVRAEVSRGSPDVLVAVAFGKIFGPKFLALFARGGVNVHPSLLPKYRGPAPIPAAILAGDSTTGVTVQRMALDVDSGDILAMRAIGLVGDETTAGLGETLGELGAQMVVEVLDEMERGRDIGTPQDHRAATYTTHVAKEDGRIDWSKPALEIERAVRAYQPWPLAQTFFGDQRLNILRCRVDEALSTTDTGEDVPGAVVRVDKSQGVLVQTGDGLLALQKLQLQSRKALEWKDFLNGVQDFVGTVLGG